MLGALASIALLGTGAVMFCNLNPQTDELRYPARLPNAIFDAKYFTPQGRRWRLSFFICFAAIVLCDGIAWLLVQLCG